MNNMGKVEIGSPIWIEQQRAICDAATPGPWEWDIATHLRECRLQTKFNGKRYVMRFVRWGVQEAAPEFQVDCRMIRADKLAKSLPGKEHHIGFDDYIDHPDALFISEARAGWPAAIDALEASIQREAEKDATITTQKNIVELLRSSLARLTAERDAAVCDMFGCMSTQGQCVRCKKRYCCDGTDDDKFSPLCKNNSHCYAWEWRGLHADNTDAPSGAESEGEHAE